MLPIHIMRRRFRGARVSLGLAPGATVVPRIALLLLALALVLGVAACGGGDEDGETADTFIEETTTDEPTRAVGRAVLVERCGSCHTLSDAGTTGEIGPNLDSLAPSADRVETQVRTGGGGMPAFEGDLSEEQIDAVSSYVADVTGG